MLSTHRRLGRILGGMAAASTLLVLAGCAGPQEVALGDAATIETTVDGADLSFEITVQSVTPADEALDSISSSGSLPEHVYFVEYEITYEGTPSDDTLELIEDDAISGNGSLESFDVIGGLPGCDEVWAEDAVEGQATSGCLPIAGDEDAVEYVQIEDVRWTL